MRTEAEIKQTWQLQPLRIWKDALNIGAKQPVWPTELMSNHRENWGSLC